MNPPTWPWQRLPAAREAGCVSAAAALARADPPSPSPLPQAERTNTTKPQQSRQSRSATCTGQVYVVYKRGSMRWQRLIRAAIATTAAALALLGAAAPASAAPHVLLVGDSLAELTSPYLSRYLPGVRMTVNAVGGYNSYQIFDLFQESYEPSQSVIVFDAGTNDNPAYPEILAGNLGKVAAVVGERCMVVPTVHGFTVEGVDNTGKNRVVARFAASRPGTQVPDWATVAETQPELMQADGLHPTAEGAAYRAQLIAQGVLGCLDYTRARADAPPPAPEVEPVHLARVGKLAERERALTEAIAMAVLRRGAAAILAGALLAGR